MKRGLHSVAIGATKALSKLLPDRVPVTFAGSDATRELCEAIASLGLAKVLVVTDAGLVDVGVAARVTDALTAVGVKWDVYSGVEPDPTFAQVEAGLDQLRREGCDAVLACGGGSPMDAAKVIAACAGSGRTPAELEGRFKVKQAPLPLFALPTTAGTGSEVTFVAVVSDTETHAKKFFVDPNLLPQMVALDPTLMLGLPPHITAATAIDALTHAVESWIAKTATPQTEAYASVAVRLIFDNLPTAHSDGTDLKARKNMALASYYAGLAFTRTSVGYVHAIAHNLGARYGTPHGLENAIALPHVLDFSKPAVEGRLARLADEIDLGGTSDADKAERFIGAVRQLEQKVGIPSTLDALQEGDIPAIAESALAEAHMNYPVPRIMSQPECEALLRNMLG
jgi:alcohol dehydrogenase class IV